jgi:hypothetical protein
MKTPALLATVLLAANFIAVPVCEAQFFKRPFKEINNAVRPLGINPERPLESTGVPQPISDAAARNGVSIPTPANPAVAPPKTPVDDLLKQAEKEAKALSDPLKPEELKKAEAKLEATKTQIKEAAREAPDYINIALRALIWERKFPSGYPHTPPNPMANPSVEVSVSQEMIDAMVNAWLGERIVLDKGFAEITQGKVTLDPRNVIVVRILQGRVKYSAFGMSHSPHIDDGTIELLPVIKKVTINGKESVKLAFRGRCTGLDIAKIGGEIDRVLAHVITKHIDIPAGIAPRDITESIAKPFDMGVASKKQLVPTATDLRAYVQNGRLVAQSKLAFTVQAAPPTASATPAPAAAQPAPARVRSVRRLGPFGFGR